MLAIAMFPNERSFMNPTAFGPLLIVISRNEVLRQDISGPLTTLKHLIANRENIRANMLNVDVSFSGYGNTSEELFEIPEVRNYVYALDAQFPFWLYFLSRHFLGLQCLAYCHLQPYLTPGVRAKSHPKELVELVERRWGPALFQICSAAGHTEAETDDLLESATQYFVSGPFALTEDIDDEDDDDGYLETDAGDLTRRLAFTSSQEYVKTSLEKACRAVLARIEQTPHSLLLGALFLRAVLQLPNAIDQLPIKLSWKVDYGESWGMKTVTIGGEGITLDTTEGYNSGMGWDHESSVDWTVDETRQTGLDEWVLEEVLSSFARDVSDAGASVYFSTDYDHEYDHLANDPEPLFWDSAFMEVDE